MWGSMLTEISFHTNFNINFSNTKSDILIHLTQWQYWWWFWFAFVWALYYLIVARVLRFRTLKFRPKIASTFRPHGKWGDLIICILPVSWCLNILINSSFLMKLIEWQNESSLFTVRIRGRQWYWIYKFDLKNFTDILSTPKNIGRNKWQISVFGDLQTSEDYMHILRLRSQNKVIKKYWTEVTNKFKKLNKSSIVSPQEQFSSDIYNTFSNNTSNFLSVNYLYPTSSYFSVDSLNIKFFNKNILDRKLFKFENFKWNSDWDSIVQISDSDLFYENSFKNTKKTKKLVFNFLDSFLLKSSNNNLIIHTDLDENSRWVKRSFGKNTPLRHVKLPIYNEVVENLDSTQNLFKLRFNDADSQLQHKPVSNATYLTLKQKRYKRRKKIPLYNKTYNVYNIDKTSEKKTYSGKLFLKNNSILINNLGDSTRQYRMMKKNKIRQDLIPVVQSKRLLRVKRTLVIPAHVNITAITNSYDVCHSWFIPGLGLKLDCVPGRATHHTFYVDNVGFYYGQCAEICGRYHHHMPIRVCALPFEHFLVWWHSFGIPKLLFSRHERKYEQYYAFRKFTW